MDHRQEWQRNGQQWRRLPRWTEGGFRAGVPEFTSVLLVIILRHCEMSFHYYLMPFVNVSSLRSRSKLLSLALGAMLGLTIGRADNSLLDNLTKDSPFGTAKSGPVADAVNQPIEFRGSMEENGQLIFSIYDTATKRSRWVGLNDTSGDVVVKSFDAEARTVSVEQNGRALALTLKSGPRIVQNVPPPMPSGMQPGQAGLPGQILPTGAGKGPEAARLNQIAEEIRRRRALRQQPPQMPMPNPTGVPASGGPTFTPGSGTGPMPMPNSNPGATSGPMPMPNSTPSSMPNFTPKQ